MTSDGTGFRLQLERTLVQPPERVFAAFVEPERLVQWWGPAGFTSPEIELDARYRIAMQPPEGALFHLRGEFRRVERPRRLVYTFEWEERHPDDRETLVELTLAPAGAGTRLVLVHGSFATAERFALHEAGWTESLERLEHALAG
jgi:uncharacterized protein YndB with AHSA1/START domain